MMWSVPPMWTGRTVAILASGPSMSQKIADRVRGLPTIAINDTILLAPWADMLYAADGEWWTSHPRAEVRAAVKAFTGLKVSLNREPVPGVHMLRQSRASMPDKVAGFEPDPGALRSGGNGGYQALHIAAHARAARVLLCGFDMHGSHWHGEHQRPLRNTDKDLFSKWIARFVGLAPILAERGLEVINCTPGSALTCFRSASLEDALAEGLERAAA